MKLMRPTSVCTDVSEPAPDRPRTARGKAPAMRRIVRSSSLPSRWLLALCVVALLAPTAVQASAGPPATPDAAAAILAAVTRRLAIAPAGIGVAMRIGTPRGMSVISWDGGARYSAASVIKLAIMAAYEEAIARGERARDTDNDALEEAMIVYSDNDAANELIDLLGLARVNATMRRLGMAQSTIGSHIETTGDDDSDDDNYLVPRECLLLMDALVHGDVGDGERVRDLLRRSLAPGSVRDAIDPGVPIYEKRGWYDGVENDVFSITLPNGTSLTLAIFQPDVEDVEAAWALFADLTRIGLTALA